MQLKRLIPLALIGAILALPATAQPEPPTIEKVCWSGGDTHAAVLETGGQYFVIVARKFILESYDIERIDGMHIGGDRIMEYWYGGQRSQMRVKVLDRMKWGYSGLMGATSACRKVVSQ